MIDLHAHILPGVDDGPASVLEAYEMALQAVADGVTVLAATPHADVRTPRRDVGRLVDELAGTLAGEGVALRLVPGAEIALSPEVPARLADRTLPTLGGTRYALIELNFEVAPPGLEQLLFEMQVAGFTPVLAHVERYRYAQRDPARLDGWADRGAVLQVTAASLRGDFGPRARQAAEYVVRSRLPGILASDAHDAQRRRPELSFARALVEAAGGPQRVVEMIDQGPRAILEDRPFPSPSGEVAPTGGLKQRLLRLFGGPRRRGRD